MPTATPELPVLRIDYPAAEVVRRLEAAARKGKLPGFEPGSGNELFRVSDFGRPFESRLVAKVLESDASGSTLGFSVQMKPVMPAVFALILAITIWPGVWLTHSMLRAYFSGYDYQTWMWYLPLTVPFVPLALFSAWRKSTSTAADEAPKIVDRVSAQLNGQPDPAAAGATAVTFAGRT